MKKNLIIITGIVSLVTGGILASKKLFYKNKNEDDKQREDIKNFYEQIGYRVHSYNENNDFILFNNDKNEKRHVLYDNGTLSSKELFDKLDAYYHHFTNEFYFISKNETILHSKTKVEFHKWAKSLFSL